MAEADNIELRRLRWPIYLGTRIHSADAEGTGILERLQNPVKVHADIQAVGALTFWNGTQIDAPITHRIFIRWIEAIENTAVAIRQTIRRDQSVRTEIFRVRRWREVTGRKRFVILEVEEELRQS